MVVFVSTKKPEKSRIYHKAGCMYARRIKEDNKMKLSVDKAESRHYCECSYCGGLKGDFRVTKNMIRHWEKTGEAECTYDKKTDTAYISTDNGFWKFYMCEDIGKYVLYHRNAYDKSMGFDEATHGSFHRQKDVKAIDSMTAIVNYVIAHDRAKTIIEEDYRNLPKHSKKQKKYYRQAKNRVKRKAIRNVYSIFDMLENKNPELKYAYKEVAYC